MKIALIGLAQSGKKTLFTLLTGRDVSGVMKPGDIFEGVAPIRDKRIDVLSSMYNPKKTTYAENLKGVESAFDSSSKFKINYDFL